MQPTGEPVDYEADGCIGMDVEGIYRKSGGNGQIQSIREGFERSNDYDISDPDLDIHAVTSLLKQYFRRLPTPLITYDVYDKLLESVQNPDDDRRIIAMRHAIQGLPACHRNCLAFLVFHLARVVEREKENLVSKLQLTWGCFEPPLTPVVSSDDPAQHRRRLRSDHHASRVALTRDDRHPDEESRHSVPHREQQQRLPRRSIAVSFHTLRDSLYIPLTRSVRWRCQSTELDYHRPAFFSLPLETPPKAAWTRVVFLPRSASPFRKETSPHWGSIFRTLDLGVHSGEMLYFLFLSCQCSVPFLLSCRAR